MKIGIRFSVVVSCSFFFALTGVGYSASEAEQHGYHAFTYSELTIIANIQEQGFTAYSESLDKAKHLQESVKQLLGKPSSESLQLARDAWIAARETV